MIRTPVTSSMITSVGHDGDVLEIEFRNGKVYRHAGVSREHFEALRNAESIGKHYNTAIRGKFDHSLVGDEPQDGDQ